MSNFISLFSDETFRKKENLSYRVLGIDLGTTNSVVSEIILSLESNDIKAKCLEIEQETFQGIHTHILIPSMVAITKEKVLVGEGAKRLRSQATEFGLEQNKNLFYECKNDIGIKKTYHRAPEGFKSASEISGKILQFLYNKALEENAVSVNRVVITVPASFQAAQRHDTLKAAQLAGLKISSGDLLDEPIAAFIDYLRFQRNEISIANTPKNLLVFDFGGGTCDIAIFRLELFNNTDPLGISPLSVSRYHRLGGGDIDTAIVYEVLLPQLIEQNNLDEFELSFEDKKKIIEPTFLSLAESLKIGLCIEIQRQIKFNKYDRTDKNSIVKKHPGSYQCRLKNRVLTLQSPKLTAQQFEDILEPFLDTDLIYAKETEYRITCSIFAPLQDAIDRSELDKTDIDYCLLVGGSSLIPQVVNAVTDYFPKSKILSYPDTDSIQSSVARGAAYHALSLALYGKGIVQTICHSSIAIKTSEGLVELVEKGTKLPYPLEGYSSCQVLAVPETSYSKATDLRVEIINKDEENLLFSKKWSIPPPVNKGDKLSLEYRYDENQILYLKMRLADKENSPEFEANIDNPLTNVVNPNSTKIEIEQIEEDIRTNQISVNQIPNELVNLAKKYSELNYYEKAMDYLKRALKAKKEPNTYILNLMGIYAGEMGDYKKQEKLYKEAAAISKDSVPLFNLSLSQESRNQIPEALESINKALAIDEDAPYFVQLAKLMGKVGNQTEKIGYLEHALTLFDPLEELTDWELHWFILAAKMLGNSALISESNAERKRRALIDAKEKKEIDGVLPILRQELKG